MSFEPIRNYAEDDDNEPMTTGALFLQVATCMTIFILVLGGVAGLMDYLKP